MLAIDFIGLIITICAVGLRYPHWALCAALIHDLGRVIMTLFLHGQIDSLVVAGAFGTASVSNLSGFLGSVLVVFSGPMANYIVGSTAGSIEFERTANLLNPFKHVKNGFAVVNLRLAVLSLFINIWQFF